MAAADILKGKFIGNDKFTLSVYPASTPIYMEIIKNGAAATLLETGAYPEDRILRTLLRCWRYPG